MSSAAEVITATEAIAPIAGTGVAGIAGAMAWWLLKEMRENRVRIEAVEVANNRTARAILLLVISMQHASEVARLEANKISREIEDSENDKKEVK